MPSSHQPSSTQAPELEVALAFLKLGLTSFGGPVAHLGYFRSEFVERRRWLSDADYADLVALCQFLPGPASSQVGMALGMLRAGWLGALLAWLAFTLPSAILLVLLALGLSAGTQSFMPHGLPGLLHGLKLVAVAVVAQAVWGMGKSLCPDKPRAAMATLAAAALLIFPGSTTQLLVIAAGGAAGWLWLRPQEAQSNSSQQPSQFGIQVSHTISRRSAAALLIVFFALLLLLPLAAHVWPQKWLQTVSAFYQAGALVFGGGHVVLPLLQSAVQSPGWVSADQFLVGYAAAQAVPGPLFTLAAYLGALLPLDLGLGLWPGATAGALLALLAIFAPAALLVLGTLPFWNQLRRHPGMRRALAGLNACVVGVLGAALYEPVWTSAIQHRIDVALALVCYALLSWMRWPPLTIVLIGSISGVLFL